LKKKYGEDYDPNFKKQQQPMPMQGVRKALYDVGEMA
jgi:hypothetical protein